MPYPDIDFIKADDPVKSGKLHQNNKGNTIFNSNFLDIPAN